MDAVVSPYHVTSREPPAMAAFLLAESCVTFLPAPDVGATTDDVRGSLRRSPRYRALLDGWSWCEALWREGVVSSLSAGEDPGDDVKRAARGISDDERLAGLGLLMKPGLFDDPDRSIDAVAADVLRAGPDPAIAVPVAAGLDRFAARLGLAVLRPHPASMAQRAEARLGRPLFACAVPILTQGDGEAILEARRMLGGSLAGLRAVLAGVAHEAARAEETPTAAESIATAHRDRLLEGARTYAAEFERRRLEIERLAEGDRVRVTHATASLTGVLLPADAVVRSSLTALRAAVGSGAPPAEPGAIVPADSTERGCFLAIFVKPL